VLVIAHRGASAQLPENTLPAFERAIEIAERVKITDTELGATREALKQVQ